MAEPLVGESITDIDAAEPGEAEVDLTLLGMGRLRGASFGNGELELEVKLTGRLGATLALELAGDRANHVGAVGLRGGASFGLWHDFKHDFHLQLEASGRIFESNVAPTRVKAGEFAPYAFGVRAAWRRSWFVARYGVGVSILGAGPVPIWADAAFMGEWGRRRRRSFAGIDVVTDWSSSVPVTVVPEVALGFLLGELQFRVGVGIPVSIGYQASDLAVGGLMRLIFELDQD